MLPHFEGGFLISPGNSGTSPSHRRYRPARPSARSARPRDGTAAETCSPEHRTDSSSAVAPTPFGPKNRRRWARPRLQQEGGGPPKNGPCRCPLLHASVQFTKPTDAMGETLRFASKHIILLRIFEKTGADSGGESLLIAGPYAVPRDRTVPSAPRAQLGERRRIANGSQRGC
jgi:hypothetical protein